ncbi:peptidylprolyl isomerase [Acetobacter nitrogenifigens]|uniref:peptidylprolyl isomerase n=2 Tax=Acetobacter nitrogenifigens TaxID=285268 RepID=A0A511XCV9_9PROT|nr:peptidylprolyl isomerase [Acetobacter nitrogenifigens]GEN60799.1 peptidyl-prolyl cis-trans isomerase [Acetobacter nitrogenifigens DSM 23921 = NBRC 105050]
MHSFSMRLNHAVLAFLLSNVAAHAAAPTPAEIVAHAPDSAWRTVAPERLLQMVMADGGRVVIELAPDFAPVHVANVVRLAQAHAWDGGAITRVQDDYVVQWRVRDEKTASPKGFVEQPPAEYDRPLAGVAFRPLGYPDPYAPQAGLAAGWAAGSDGARVWPAQCYGTVGVGREMPPDTGDGRELYVVNGEAPRQLDRNLAVVGRVLVGMEYFGALRRGTGALGFYTDAHQDVPIKSMTLAADLPQAARPHVQTMRTDSPTFAAYLDARAARTDPFFVRAAHGVALCNVPVPSREVR